MARIMVLLQEGGRWVNWWGRNRHGLWAILTNIWKEKDNSSIPEDQAELDRTLPVRRPYWLQSELQTPADVGTPGVRATWLGHATVLAEVDGAIVLTDPIFSQRASMVQWAGPKRYRPPGSQQRPSIAQIEAILLAACNVSELPRKLHAVVISHNHYDHLDYNSVQALHARYGDSLQWFVPADMGAWFEDNHGVKAENVHELTWWQEKRLPGHPNVTLALTPSNHWGRRGPMDENKALWGSWAIMGPKHRFWFGGDTGYSDGFTQIGRRYGPFDLSAIPIGAYEPRWFMKFVHVNPGKHRPLWDA